MANTQCAPFTVQVVEGPPAGSMSFQLSSAIGGTDLPFTLGFAFRQGDIRAGADAVATLDTLQVTPKSRWPDGSLKFAIVCGHATLSPGTPLSVQLSSGKAAGGTALTTSRLRATGIAARVSASGFGAAAWSGADWDQPFLAWVSGPLMSSWIYRKPVGTDDHLVAWLEVRLYAGGQVEVLPWVENGYLLREGATSKAADYSFELGGTQRHASHIDLPHHCRAVLVSGSAGSHWLATDPQVIPRHDTVYLQATRLVPRYGGALSPTATLWNRLVQVHEPLAAGNYSPAMGMAGYHGSIGPLPEWDVAYLCSGGDARAWQSVMVHGYAAGRYAIHYRDESTQRPLRFSSHPHLLVRTSSVSAVGSSSKLAYTPVPSGTTAPTWTSSHHPSIGFFAYLLSGRFFFMEETQFAATLNYLKQPDQMRLSASGVLRTETGANTTRGAAWALRTLAQAACATPDDDSVLRAEFVASWENNIAYYHHKYVATPNNPQGICIPYSDYTAGDGIYKHAMWMEDFLTFAFGYGRDLELGSDASRALHTEFNAWKYRSVVGRLGGSQGYCYRDAALYTSAVAPTDSASAWNTGTGPWYANWRELYEDALGHPNDCDSGTTLRGTSAAHPSGMSTGYWGNLHPALAYAVDHGAEGALAAYTAMTSASNYAEGAKGFNTSPVWSVKPRSVG